MFTITFVLLITLNSVLGYNCTNGFDCIGTQVCTGKPTKCGLGSYCPGELLSADFCKVGSFCSDPSQTKRCPSGYICSEMTVTPLECGAGSLCEEGVYHQRPVIGVVIFMFFVIALVSLITGRSYITARKATKALLVSSNFTSAPSTQVNSDSASLKGFNLECKDLKLSLKTSHGSKQVLKGVSGHFHAGKITAILGPSGAGTNRILAILNKKLGKTTVMNILRGKISGYEGTILINGKEDSINKYKKVVGFVPQEDVMLRTLTVRQILQHSARLRLPRSWSDKQKMSVVEEVISVLKLNHIADNVIGDETKRGVSGGERKRVNIGIELVAQPHILFLDEPTTGLDSTTSQELMELCKKIARRGITIIPVLHQPRYEILQLCDDLLLLGTGGRTVYMGPAGIAADYFSEIGYKIPPNFNPADFFLDVVSGQYSESSSEDEDISISFDGTSIEMTKNQIGDLVESWGKYGGKYQSQSVVLTNDTVGDAEVDREVPNFIEQFGIYFYRNFIYQTMNIRSLLLAIFYAFVPGAAMGVASNQSLFIPPIPGEMIDLCPEIIRDRCRDDAIQGISINITSFFFTMTFAVGAVINAVNSFAVEKSVYYRESSAGANKMSYFLAKVIFDLWNIARDAFVSWALFMFIGGPVGSASGWYLITFFLIFASYRLGYSAANMFDTVKALVIAVVTVVAWAVTSGLSPTLKQVRQYPPMEVIWSISYPRWASEAIYLNAVEGFDQDDRINEFLKTLGFDHNNFALDIGMMLVLGIVWRILSFIALYFKNRKLQ